VGTAAAAGFSVGSLVAVDVDYTGQLGYIGTGVAAAYVQSAGAVGSDVNYVRRVTLNVGVVAAIANGVLQLANPLPAGVPARACRSASSPGSAIEKGRASFRSGRRCL